MKIALTKDVKDLGKAGQIVNVAEGYARNFLFPRKLAVAADEGVVKTLDQKKKILAIKGEKQLEQAKEIAARLAEIEVKVVHKAGTGTKLYGSVTTHDIAEALLKQHKIDIDKRKLHIEEPIKSTGHFDVPVKLHHDVNSTIKVNVTAES